MNDTICRDHKGTEYPSRTAMLKIYGLSTRTFKTRLKFGWSLEKALTEPIRKVHVVTDHNGTVYATIVDMAAAYGINVSTLQNRIKLGWSIEDALTKDIRTVRDHLGNTYDNMNNMLEKYNISESTYHTRLTRGWSLEKALTTPIKTTAQGLKIEDPYGNTYDSMTHITSQYNIRYNLYTDRINKGYTTAEALGIIPMIKPKIKNAKITDSLIILKSIIDNETNTPYYHCLDCNQETVYNRSDLLERCKEELNLKSL